MSHARLFPIPFDGSNHRTNTAEHSSPAVSKSTTPTHPDTSTETYRHIFQRISENIDPRADQMYDLDCEEIGSYLRNRH
jgi:hypothetical protein